MDRGETARRADDRADGREGAALVRPGSSLAMRCLGVIAVYALALVALLLGANAAVQRLFDTAFPSMDTVLAYEDDLERDRFAPLQTSEFSQCQIVVFEGDGTRLYASSDEAGERLRASYLPLISDYEEESFYEVFLEGDGAGELYRIMLCSYGEDGAWAGGAGEGTKTVEAWCLVDGDLSIVAGDLFAGRTALSQREFGFIKGVYDARMSVERYDYETVDGRPRTLVLAAPLVSDAAYARVVDQSGRVVLVVVPVALAVTALAAWVIARMVRRAARPLDRAIDAYRSGAPMPRDVSVPSELARTYDNFTDLMDELDDARRERQRIVADVSHDLKTPLTVIRGYAQAFCDGRVPPERADAYHRAIAERAVAASDLIDTLLSYAKMEHPEYEPALEPVDVAELVRDVARGAQAAVEQAGCALEVEAPAAGSGGAVALVDVQLFRRALLNLIDNAWKHNGAGVRIRVSCSADGERGRAVVRVADTGRGFPPELASRAFESFVTENVARTADGGTGLGLSIARRAVELMGGSIRLEEGPEAPWSTVLTIELPLERRG